MLTSSRCFGAVIVPAPLPARSSWAREPPITSKQVHHRQVHDEIQAVHSGELLAVWPLHLTVLARLVPALVAGRLGVESVGGAVECVPCEGEWPDWGRKATRVTCPRICPKT